MYRRHLRESMTRMAFKVDRWKGNIPGGRNSKSKNAEVG